MAIQAFDSFDDLFNVAETNPASLVTRKVYSSRSSIVVNDILYLDEDLNNPVQANAYLGVFIGSTLYAIRTDANGRIIEMQQTGSGGGVSELQIYPDIALGIVEYDTSKNVGLTRSKLSITRNSSNRLIMNDVNWSTDFGSQAGYVKGCYLDVEESADAEGRALQNLDITELEGFEVAPFVAYMNPTSKLLGNYGQHFIHIPEGDKNRRSIVQGDKIYQYLPESFQWRNSVLPSFYKNFPDYEVPSNKLSSSQFFFEDLLDPNDYLSKGRTYSLYASGNRRHFYDYEKWAEDLGMPRSYTNRDLAKSVWAGLTLTQARNAFYEKVVLPNRNNGMTTLNFEIFSYLNDDQSHSFFNDSKLYNVLTAWHDSNPSSKLSFWAGGKGPIFLNNQDLQNAPNSSGLTPDLKFTGSYTDWMSQRLPLSLFGANYYMFTALADVFYVNDYYFTRFDTPQWLHQYLMALMMCRKFFPDKKYLFMMSHLMETTVFQPADFFQVKSNNEVFKLENKPAVPPSVMWTASLFSMFYGDGNEIWNDPYYMCTDPKYFGGFAKNHLDQNLYNSFRSFVNSGTPGMFVLSGMSMHGLDRWEAAKYYAWLNRDIIESATPWEWPEISLDNGSTWITGDDLLPSETLFSKKPIALFKPHPNGLDGILLFYHPWQNPLDNVNYKIRLSGSIVKDIFQIGKYASCVRLKI